MNKVKLFFTFLILLIHLFNVNAQAFEVTPVYPYCINGTAYITNLEDYKEDYLYFCDDFYDGCNKETDKFKYYKLNSEINLINNESSLNYAMLEREGGSYNIKIEEIKDLNWKPIKSLYPYEPDSHFHDYNWYFEIKKEDKKNVVLFRVAKNGHTKGELSMYTQIYTPNIIEGTDEEEDKATDKGTDKVTDEATDKGTDKEADEATDKGTDKVADEATDKGTDKGADEATDKGTDETTDKGTDKDKETDKFILVNASNYLSKINYFLLILFIYFA